MVAQPVAEAPAAEFRGKIYDSILDTIGATPLVRVRKLAEKYGVKADILAKLEFFNPLSSVKDRIGRAMIETLEADGVIEPGKTTLIGLNMPSFCGALGSRKNWRE